VPAQLQAHVADGELHWFIAGATGGAPSVDDVTVHDLSGGVQ
jgi:hypothetical protein